MTKAADKRDYKLAEKEISVGITHIREAIGLLTNKEYASEACFWVSEAIDTANKALHELRRLRK